MRKITWKKALYVLLACIFIFDAIINGIPNVYNNYSTMTTEKAIWEIITTASYLLAGTYLIYWAFRK